MKTISNFEKSPIIKEQEIECEIIDLAHGGDSVAKHGVISEIPRLVERMFNLHKHCWKPGRATIKLLSSVRLTIWYELYRLTQEEIAIAETCQTIRQL
ncbi:MAG: hypothetical protein WC560_02375 [Syntrophales bacterium]